MTEATHNTLVIDGPITYTGDYRQQEVTMADGMAAEVLRLREGGMGIAQIARALGKGNAFVTKVLKETGTYGQPYYMTREEKDEARRLRLEGHSHEDIAEMLGRSKAAIVELMKKLKLNDRVIRPILVKGNLAEIELTRDQLAIIDAADVPIVQGRSWFAMGAGGKFYAATRENGKPITLHRFLMKAPADKVVDHIDGDGLNNTRANLRLATTRENAANGRRALGKGGFIGVQEMRSGKFFGVITLNLGTFDTAEEAARAYDAKATELFGEFAMTNKRKGLLD